VGGWDALREGVWAIESNVKAYKRRATELN